MDEDEAFLYGDEENDEQEVVAEPAKAAEESEQEEEQEDESDDDLEIVLDTDPAHIVAPPPIRRPPVRPVVTQTTTTVTDPSTGKETTIVEEKTVIPTTNLKPLGSLVPLENLPEDPSIDVNAVQKDANGNDLFDLDIDSLEEKPWRAPGANVADWFNYGMNEVAWKNYTMKQRKTRLAESAEYNPWAGFSGGNLQEAYQSLSPENKALLMATVMGYPASSAQNLASMMKNPMAMMGMGNMQMGNMQMGNMSGYGMPYQQSENYDEYDEDRSLPANVPTGPRKQIPTGPRRSAYYQDKDKEKVEKSEGLDYGGDSYDSRRKDRGDRDSDRRDRDRDRRRHREDSPRRRKHDEDDRRRYRDDDDDRRRYRSDDDDAPPRKKNRADSYDE